MGVEQYRALFMLVSGASLFFIMLLVLRGMSRRNQGESALELKSEEGWHNKEQLRIVEIVNESETIKSFRLRRMGNKPMPSFLPGQFISFQIGEDEKLIRSYSIASSSESRASLVVAVKALKDGKGSPWFHSLKVGDMVWGYPPRGHFVDPAASSGRRVYVAGGVGITPILSMILTHIDAGLSDELHLFYGVRNQSDLAYHSLLLALSERHLLFSYTPILSHDESWSGARGYIDLQFVKSKVPLSKQEKFFICGPLPLIEGLTKELLDEGYSEEQILFEKFVSPASFDPQSLPTRRALISYQGQSYQYDGRQTLLEF